ENDKIVGINFDSPLGHPSLFFKILSNMKKLRCPFPDGWKPMKLGVLELWNSLQKELWKGYKHLPHLKVLVLASMTNLLGTPDFDGLPCLQKLTLLNCDELKEIHSSLGKHSGIEYLRMFPTIVQMGKLKTLEINTCCELMEFPEIKSNMKQLVKLCLSFMGIDVLLSLIGERCANLISLRLWRCFSLKSIEVNFNGLKHLEEFTFNGLDYMNMPDRLGISLRHWYGSHLSIWLRLVFPRLRKLDLHGCGLRDGEIPSDIGKLHNLLELDLSGNDFTRFHFSLSQLTQLKRLVLNDCNHLLELPKIPSDIVVLEADRCKSLTTVGDFYTDCKWLCHVSIMKGVPIDGQRLLDFMLQGKTIENHCMLLCVEGLGIAKKFSPPLIRGIGCRLKLPENWCTDFCGFLIVAVTTGFSDFYASELMRMDNMMSEHMDFKDDVVWEERDNDKITYALPGGMGYTKSDSMCSGFGARLVARKSGAGLTETLPTQESEISKRGIQLMAMGWKINILRFVAFCSDDDVVQE
ncbi:hypothetical protein M8C21_024446, partial [Ambrosia artemisiifolia]